MSEKYLGLDNQPHELKLGASFDPKSRVAFHSIRYDFKPASVDTNQEAQVEIGEGHHVTLTVPHVEGSGKMNTVYKGNKRPVSKECVLIIDHDTGTFTLERLSNNINVKKTRSDSSNKAQLTGRPVTPVDPKLKSSPGKTKSSQNSPAPVPAPALIPAKQPSPPVNQPVAMPKRLEEQSSVIGEISDSSSDSDSLSSDSSDSEDDHNDKAIQPVTKPVITPQPAADQQNKQKGLFTLSTKLSLAADLQLSDSDSDSD